MLLAEKRITLGLMLVAVLAGAAVGEGERAPSEYRGKVTEVLDGDTVVLRSGNQNLHIRLYGIDAPESAQRYGQSAKLRLTELVDGKTVRVSVQDRDSYGRVVGIVYLGSTDINHTMVREGLAWWNKKYAPYMTLYKRSESAARAAGRGLWGDKNPTPPWEWRREH